VLTRQAGLAERERQFTEMIEAAAAEMALLLDQLGLAARIAGGRYEPRLRDADTLELARSQDEHVAVVGTGATVTIDADAAATALASLAQAARRHGELARVTWSVEGRLLRLGTLPERAQAVVSGESPRDLGALVARMQLEALGCRLSLVGGELRVEIA
jgi:hypothetical protein